LGLKHFTFLKEEEGKSRGQIQECMGKEDCIFPELCAKPDILLLSDRKKSRLSDRFLDALWGITPEMTSGLFSRANLNRMDRAF
jgi:hypothetical protein